MRAYDWPRNVRELRNVIERAVALCQGTDILLQPADIWLADLGGMVGGPLLSPSADIDYRPISLDALEHEHILRTLKYTKGVKTQAALILGIERSTLDRKMKAYNITPER